MNTPPAVTKRLNDFSYYAPASIAEAVSIVSQNSSSAAILAGGTDLLVMMKAKLVTPEVIISMKKIPDLSIISDSEEEIQIGTLTVVADILKSEAIKKGCRSLHEAAEYFATPHVRNMATVGGNICRSSPGGDLLPPLISMNARLRLVGANGERIQPIADFFTGPGQNTLDREILTEIILPKEAANAGSAFAKLTRNSSDLAKVSCAVYIEKMADKCSEIRIVLGAVADRPVRLRQVEQILMGKTISIELIEEAVSKTADHISPITDARSTEEYRKQVSSVLTARTISRAWERAV